MPGASALRFALTLRGTKVCLALALGGGFSLCLSPLLGVHGYESALLLGLVLPPLAAWLAAHITHALRVRGQAVHVHEWLEATAVACLSLWALPCVVLWLDALRVRNCTPLEGAAFMVLGPLFGVVLGALVGMCTAAAVKRRRAAVALALVFPLGSIATALLRFYYTPAIFAYGHFYGYFSGTLYDEGVAIGGRFLALRGLTSAWISGLLLLAVSSFDAAALRLSVATARRHRTGTAAGLALCVGAASCELLAPALGHATNAAHIREQLGAELSSRRCMLVFPRELPKPERKRLAEDCDFRVAQAEAWLGVTHPAPVVVYAFRSPDEKAALMGAAHTNIAKPWRSEVYITHAPWPHPVLGHEVVHIVAASIGRGPFRISGAMHGLWPNAALIEGVASAAAWQAQGGLTSHEWARALLELGKLPSLESLFGVGFLGAQPRMAYTLSASLLRFVAERYGSGVVRRAYTTGDLAAAVGKNHAALEAEWRNFVSELPMSTRALALARARFTGVSIFSAVCPHALASLRTSLRADLASGDDLRASAACAEILEIDPRDGETRATLAALWSRLGDDARARQELAPLLAPETSQPALAAMTTQAWADEALRRGDRTRAAALYDTLLQQPMEDDALRAVQVKALAARGAATQAQLLFELLVGAPGERSDGATAVHLARELRSVRTDGLPHYLEGRQLFFQTRFARAAPLLAQSLALGLPSQELTAEARRTAAISAFAAGQLDHAEREFRTLANDESLGRAAEAQDWLARIRFTRRR